MPPTEYEPTSLLGKATPVNQLSVDKVTKIADSLEDVLQGLGIDPENGVHTSNTSGDAPSSLAFTVPTSQSSNVSVSSSSFDTQLEKLSASDQRKLLAVIRSAGLSAEDKQNLAELLTRTVQGKPALISGDRDARLLDSLYEIATTEDATIRKNVVRELREDRPWIKEADASQVVDALISQRASLIKNLLAETADPLGKVHQGGTATCPVSTDLIRLTVESPAEYARIASELFTEGKAQGRYGSELHLVDDSVWADARYSQATEALGIGYRTISERMIQSSLMQYAVETRYSQCGRYAAYSCQSDETKVYSEDGGQIADSFKGLHDSDAEYATQFLYGGVERVDLMHASQALREKTVALMAEDLENGKIPKVSTRWSSGGIHSFHVLNVIGIEGDSVLLRNPWGSVNLPPGSYEEGPPPRTLVDPHRGIYAVAKNDFMNNIRYAVIDNPTSLGVAADIIDDGALSGSGDIQVAGVSKGDYDNLTQAFGFDSSGIIRDIFLGRKDFNLNKASSLKTGDILKEVLQLALGDAAGIEGKSFMKVAEYVIGALA